MCFFKRFSKFIFLSSIDRFIRKIKLFLKIYHFLRQTFLRSANNGKRVLQTTAKQGCKQAYTGATFPLQVIQQVQLFYFLSNQLMKLSKLSFIVSQLIEWKQMTYALLQYLLYIIFQLIYVMFQLCLFTLRRKLDDFVKLKRL